jgi:hypothetical protein
MEQEPEQSGTGDYMAARANGIIDTDEYSESFMEWRKNRCASSSRFSTNVNALYRDYAAWAEINNDWPCDLEQFKVLLQWAGAWFYTVRGVFLASGIGLTEDVQAARQTYGRRDSARQESTGKGQNISRPSVGRTNPQQVGTAKTEAA